jgi:hypothetical protein
VQQLGDVVDRERGDLTPPERREQVAVELVAVPQGARMTLAGGDLRLKALEPLAGDRLGSEAAARPAPFPSRVAAISASRSRRASATSNPTVRKRNRPAWHQQTANLTFRWR